MTADGLPRTDNFGCPDSQDAYLKRDIRCHGGGSLAGDSLNSILAETLCAEDYSLPKPMPLPKRLWRRLVIWWRIRHLCRSDGHRNLGRISR